MTDERYKYLSCPPTQEVCFWDELGGYIFNNTAYMALGDIKASRAFASEKRLPPTDFAAYGVVVFKNSAGSEHLDRFHMVCEAYLNSLSHISQTSTPRAQQMVTIWPMASETSAENANKAAKAETCDVAVPSYGLNYSLKVLQMLESGDSLHGSFDVSGDGPFLIARSPTKDVDGRETVALFYDLSSVLAYDRMLLYFSRWRDKIQENPELWQDGFEEDSLVIILRDYFDGMGSVFSLGSG